MLRTLLLTTALTCTALAAEARENYALLVGASTYDNLDQKFWLKGPQNDIDLVRTYLLSEAPVAFSDETLTVLADGVDGAGRPTLAAIRAAFADLAEKVQPGDFVYLHFSGHGSQAPAADPDSELDGLDELFLPVDIGPWEDSVGTVKNALVDDEIGALIGALRARGATVWAVFDSCHSGTVTRGTGEGGEEEVRLRKLPPEALGVPADALEDAATQTRALPDPRQRPESPMGAAMDAADQDAAGEGAFVAFYAAQTNETTPEMRMPPGQEGRRSQGVFTFTIFQTLAERPGITYGQLAQEVLRKYTVFNLARSTPMFEGDLDRVVFGGEGASPLAQWPADISDGFAKIKAGSLHGLSEGSLMAIMASPADETDAALGYVQVDYTDTFLTEALPVAANGKPAPDLAALPKGIYLRKLGEELDFGLTVALPPVGAIGDRVATVIARLQADEVLGPRLRFVPAGQAADLRMAILPDSPRPDAVWMLPAAGVVDETMLAATPSVSTGDKDDAALGEVLADTLTHIAKVTNVLKLGQAFDGEGLDVDMALKTKTRRERDLRNLDTAGVPRLIPGDEVHVEATNNMGEPVDLNVLYIGSDLSITHMFAGRLQPGDTLKQGLLRITDTAFGRDRVVLVLTPARPKTATENLGFLAEDALPMTRAADRGTPGFDAVMAEAGFGTTTRAAISLADDTGPSAGIMQFEIDTVPGQ